MPSKVDAPGAKDEGVTLVTADYGGRRETFDRRRKQSLIVHSERRSGKERRSGFDRRSALPPIETNDDQNKTPPDNQES